MGGVLSWLSESSEGLRRAGVDTELSFASCSQTRLLENRTRSNFRGKMKYRLMSTTGGRAHSYAQSALEYGDKGLSTRGLNTIPGVGTVHLQLRSLIRQRRNRCLIPPYYCRVSWRTND